MRRVLMYALLLAPIAAHADFLVAGSRSPAPDASAVTTHEAFTTGGTTAPGADAAAASRFTLAQGFGSHVPLSFAVRQIVPRAIKVTYGPGADPNALVDWKGGQGWNRVLSRAVQPLGLRLVMSNMAVQIRE